MDLTYHSTLVRIVPRKDLVWTPEVEKELLEQINWAYLSKSYTPFQVQVWRAIASVPWGETRTYKEIGEMIGSRGYQAIGTACGKNPLPLAIPCHRILSSSGLGGYEYGLPLKKSLLKQEGVKM